MKLPLDTPTVTAHALGELPPTEARLMSMTFHDPVAARYLEEESEIIRGLGASLQNAFKLESNEALLSDAQRQRILALTASPYPEGKSAPAPQQKVEHQVKPLKVLLEERKQFDRRPARLATYLTGGAAAAVIVLLASLRTKEATSGGSASAGGLETGNGAVVSGPVEKSTGTFKVVQPNADKEQKNKDARKSLAGVPQSSLGLPTNSAVPPIPVPPQTQKELTLTTPPKEKSMAKPELPRTVKVPESETPKPAGEMQMSKTYKPRAYAAPKPKE